MKISALWNNMHIAWEILKNLPPAGVYFGRDKNTLLER
jgi:hypothetical protein